MGDQKMKGGFLRTGCLYSSAVKNDNSNIPETEEIKIETDISALESRHGRAVLVRVQDFNSLISLNKTLSDFRFKEVELQYVGGFNMLNVFGDDEAASGFLKSGEEWKVWFSHAELWVGQALAYERVAWLRVHGVPLHLWTDKVFDLICGRFGIVPKLPHVSDEDADLSMVCVGVLVGDGKRITEEVVLNWKNKRYRVWVSKDIGDWILDCIEDEEASDYFDDGVSMSGSENLPPECQ
ncbi:hypothetical protein Hdeb2414_s0052g00752841 [Helianthus debilis subsp. tardiflorus]